LLEMKHLGDQLQRAENLIEEFKERSQDSESEIQRLREEVHRVIKPELED
jgi:hypothetical protein